MQAQETELAKRGFGPFFIINTFMKIIAINVTELGQQEYVDKVSNILNTEVICLSYKDIDPSIITDSLYTKLSLGALTLEQYVIDHPNYNTYDKAFVNAFMFWDSSLDKIERLQPYIDVMFKNWFMVQDQLNPKWIFGDIKTLIKWAGSLHKINENDFYYVHPHLKHDFTSSLVYAGRIGLNVQGLV